MSIKIDTNLAPVISQATITSAIVTAMSNAGFGTVYDSYNSGGIEYRVWELNFNALIYGKVYLQISVTAALGIQQRLYTSWNLATDTGANAGTQSTAVTFATGASINFAAIKPNTGNEYGIVVMYQGTTIKHLGYLRPLNKPVWWDENTYAYCFIPTTIAWTAFATVAIAASPYGSATLVTNAGDSSMNTFALDGKRDVLTGLFINSGTSGANANTGKACRTSEEIGICSGSGTTLLSLIQVTAGSDEYYVLNPIASAPVIKV